MLDLFSGIGGFSLAAEWAGIETAAFCEQDLFCQQVLKKHWPSVPIVDDIFKLRGDEFGPVDIVSGGFPCQPFSLAGKRKGTDDDRHLWPEMFRIIKEARPTWVLGENVPGIINLALDGVLSDLEGIGYEVQPLIIPACAVDAPHRRDRVWIVAHSDYDSFRVIGQGEDVAHANTQPGLGECGEALADAQRSGRDGRTNDQARRVLPGWEAFEGCGTTGNARITEPGLGGMVNGVPTFLDGYWPDEPQKIPRTRIKIPNRSARLKALGNSIVPEVAYMFFNAIVSAESAE